MGSRLGVEKIAAAKVGLSLDEYRARVAGGQKRCTRCKGWKPIAGFGRDGSRADGRDSSCFSCRRVTERVCTKGRASTFKGRRHTAEALAKMSAWRTGRPSGRRGIPRSAETRAKISAKLRVTAARGDRAAGYIDGKCLERQGLRRSMEAKRWRYDVMSRDSFMCRHCGEDRGGNLNAHHIRPWATEPDLRFETRNGVTLCKPCHWVVHAYGLSLWSPCQ